jgi:outer membrane protein assembly factor BamD (BamD/ComL family)
MLKNTNRKRRNWTVAGPVLGFVLVLGVAGPAWAEPAAEAELLARNGRVALEDGQYELAEKLFSQCLAAVAADSPASADARIGMARAAYGRKAYRVMLDALPAAAAPRRGQLWAAAYRYHRALALYELGSEEEALAELDDPEMAADNGPLVADARRLQAWIYLRQARWTDADRAFTAWETLPMPESVRSTNSMDWAAALTATGRFQQAGAVLQRLLDRHPEPPLEWRARYELARAQAGQGLTSEAETNLTAILVPLVDPAIRLAAWLTRAELEEGRTNWPGAWVAASNAMALAVEPAGRRRTRTAAGRLLLRSGSLSRGAELLQAVIAEEPADPQAPVLQLALARAYLDAGRAVEAEANYQYYLESFTNAAGVAEALEGRAWSLLGLKRFTEAAAGFEKAAAAAAEPARRDRLAYKAGDAYFANRQFQLAADTYCKVMESAADPSLVREARFQAAETEARLGRLAEAQDRFAAIEKASAGTDMAERAALRVAELYQDSGTLTAARAAYDRFLAVYSNSLRSAAALYNRGLVNYQVYLFEPALADFNAVLTRYPDSPHAENAAYMRVCAAFELYNDSRAERLAREFLESHPVSTWVPQLRFRLAEFAFNRGIYEEAEKEFMSVADGHPKDPLAGDALFWAARAASGRKQFKKAIEYDTRLVREHPDHPKTTEAVFFQAEALVELGDYAGAITIFEEVVKRQPDSFLAYVAKGRRGDCQFTLGADDPARFEDAIRSYTEVADNPKAPFELRLQAAFKIGRGRQKLGRTDEAFEQYYTKVILVFLESRQAGLPMNESCTAWFTRAAFEGAAILESKGRWRQAVRLYQRVVDAGVTAADDARRRIESIQREHWRFF